MAITPDGSTAVSASGDNTLNVWDLVSGDVVAGFAADHPLQCCCVSPLGKTIAAGDSSGVVHFFQIEGMSFPPTDKAKPVPIGETDRDEVMAVIREVFSRGAQLQRAEAIREIARQLGFGRVGSRIRQALDDDIRTAVRRGILDNSLDGLSLLCRSIDEYERDHLIAMLLAAMGATWWPQEDAIRAAARHMGYRRAGSKIQAAFKSAIRTARLRGLLERDGKHIRKTK